MLTVWQYKISRSAENMLRSRVFKIYANKIGLRGVRTLSP